MHNNKLTFWISIAIILGVALWLGLRNRAAAPTSAEPNTASSTQPAGQFPAAPGATTIEEYVRQNISVLAPVPASLGGTFYVTKIEAHGGAGTVEYEDGHSAYTADFTYTIDEEGIPHMATFTLRSEN
jgi:hypothetical protein